MAVAVRWEKFAAPGNSRCGMGRTPCGMKFTPNGGYPTHTSL